MIEKRFPRPINYQSIYVVVRHSVNAPRALIIGQFNISLPFISSNYLLDKVQPRVHNQEYRTLNAIRVSLNSQQLKYGSHVQLTFLQNYYIYKACL